VDEGSKLYENIVQLKMKSAKIIENNNGIFLGEIDGTK